MFKKQYLFLILLVCLFAVSAVSAEDNSTSDIVSVSNDNSNLETNILEINEDSTTESANDTDTLKMSNDKVLTAENNNWYVNSSKTSSGDGKSDADAFKTLNEAINSATNGDTINIASGEYKRTNNIGLTINKNLNFIKYGDAEAIFDAKRLSRIWAITATSINITGLTFKNGKANNGSAIYLTGSGNVTNCNFMNCSSISISNSSSSGGGAIYISGSGNVTNCNFMNCSSISISNSSSSSGYSSSYSSGGAIYISGSGNVTNCNFINCTASSSVIISVFSMSIGAYGGAIYIEGSGNVTNCSFVNCSSSSSSSSSSSIFSLGGAIYFNKIGTATNCSFVNCCCCNNGGAIFFGRGSVSNCSFVNCSSSSSSSSSHGGAIYFEYGSGCVVNCIFVNCFSSIYGGNIYISQWGNVANCSFVNCSSTNGGAICIDNGNVTNCSFVNCSSSTNGGAICIGNGNVTNCSFVNCSSYSTIYYFNFGICGSVSNCSFVNCSSTNGGAIYIDWGNVNNCYFVNCNSTNGGAIYFRSTSTATNCSFVNCSSSTNGGAIYFERIGTVTNCSFVNCSSSTNGGAIYFYGSGNVTNCSFINCSSSSSRFRSYCGAIYFYGSGNVTNCSFVNCSSSNFGGAIRMTSGNISNCSFVNCSGGAISFGRGSVSNCSFVNCSGGAISLSGGSVSNCSFVNCSSSTNGGAIYFSDSGNVTNCSFVNCSSSTNGGAIYMGSGNVTNCSFVNCFSSSSRFRSDCGAIYFSDSGNVTNCSFVNCSSSNSCGAIYFSDSGNIANCSFMNCISTNYGNGGAVYFNYVLDVVNSSFVNCSSSTNGGAIYGSDNVYYCTVYYCTFVNCSSSSYSNSYGGAIYLSSRLINSANVYYCTFVNCSTSSYSPSSGYSGSYGGAIYLSSRLINSANVYYCTFVNCSSSGHTTNLGYGSSSGGGAVYGSNNVYYCTFVNCSSSSYGHGSSSGGGAIGMTSGNVYYCSFVNCKSSYSYESSYGGAIGMTSGNVYYCSFVNNTAEYGNSIASIDEHYNSNLNIINCKFFDKNSIYLCAKSSELACFINLVNNSEIINNEGEFFILNNEWWNLNLSNNSFISPIYNKGKVLSKTNITILDNTTKIYDSNPVTLDAFIQDDNHNFIIMDEFTFNVNNTQVNASFNNQNHANINYNLTTAGKYFVTCESDALMNNTIYTGILIRLDMRIPTNITVNMASLNLTVGETGTIDATLYPSEAGNLTFTSNNAHIATVDTNGVVTAIAEGNAIITVSFAGNEEYAPAESKTINVTVKLRDASVIVNNDTLNLIVDDIFDIIAITVPPGLKVTYTTSDASIVTVDANGKVTAKAKGSAIITAGVGGDGVYVLNSTNVGVTVNEKPIPPKENLTIGATAKPITVGENANVIVTGLKDATGNVIVTVNSKTYTGSIKNGEATVIVPGLTKSVTASVNYPGDGKYNSASTTVKITVNPKPKENLTISASAEPITVGENANVIVTGLKDATGEVIVTVNGKTYTGSIKNGGATVIVPGLKETVTASVNYPGDSKYNSASTTVKITVNPKPKENLTISASSKPITVGENANVVVTGLKDATGEISVIVNGKKYTSPIKGGEASVTISGLTESITANVNYPGDEKYNSASTTVKITVNPDVIIYAPDVTKYYGGPERFIVTLTDLSGNPIKNAVVKITINGRTSERVTDDNGIASMGINLNSGVYITTTEYNGTKVNSTVTVKDTVIAKDFSKIFRNGTQYQGTFVDSQGNLIRNTDIEININGVFYTRKTNDNGIAQMNINLPPGTYILTATNPLSKEQHTTKVTVLPNIVENHDLTKYYKNASQYSLRLLDDKGNPVGAGVSIQLNINGVFYTRTSDANGYVKMNINLPPGTYTVTAEYKGLRASNKITVLSVLETKDLVMKYKDGSKFEAKILDGQGNPYAGQTVTFNINGVFYTKTTEADGIARLKINLLAGEYIITSMYNGLNAANKVTISA